MELLHGLFLGVPLSAVCGFRVFVAVLLVCVLVYKAFMGLQRVRKPASP